jgi:hypothetical protein
MFGSSPEPTRQEMQLPNLLQYAADVNRFLQMSTKSSMSTREQSQPPPVLILERPGVQSPVSLNEDDEIKGLTRPRAGRLRLENVTRGIALVF